MFAMTYIFDNNLYKKKKMNYYNTKAQEGPHTHYSKLVRDIGI